MFSKRKFVSKAIGFGLGQVVFFLIISLTVTAQNNSSATRPSAADTSLPHGLPYPIHDSRSDFMSSGTKSTFDFKNPPNFTDSVSFDFGTQRYTLYEKIGDKYYKTPTTYSFEEYWQLR